jgi:hypothetical protein
MLRATLYRMVHLKIIWINNLNYKNYIVIIIRQECLPTYFKVYVSPMYNKSETKKGRPKTKSPTS